MAILEIVKEGDKLLRQKSKPVKRFSKELCRLLDDMYETMTKSNGCGIACPQVGVLLRAFIIEIEGLKIILFPLLLTLSTWLTQATTSCPACKIASNGKTANSGVPINTTFIKNFLLFDKFIKLILLLVCQYITHHPNGHFRDK